MTHGVNIPFSCRVVRDLILSIINQGRFDAHLANGIIRGNPFSELNRLLSDGILAEPNVPKGDCKGTKSQGKTSKNQAEIKISEGIVQIMIGTPIKSKANRLNFNRLAFS